MLKTEPAFIMGLILAVVSAGLNVLLAFGISVTGDQIAAINGIVTVALALGLSLYTRSRVTPLTKL
jgi:hypothetical protein